VLQIATRGEFAEDLRIDRGLKFETEWMREYNEERPHDTVGRVPPSLFSARQTAGSSPLKLSP